MKSYDIENLKSRVRGLLSERRYLHTLGVMKMAEFLAEKCYTRKTEILKCAALLHDITKELSRQEQLALLSEGKIKLDEEDLNSFEVIHSFTAPVYIQKEFSEYAEPEILSAVSKHTLGSPEMSVCDEIIFLSDFIEETRKYDASVSVRKYVVENMTENYSDENLSVFHNASIMEIMHTEKHLSEKGVEINSKNILTKNALIDKIKNNKFKG